MKKRITTQQKIWFKRWSKKPWAVFRSMHSVVHILQLKTSISKQMSLKQNTSDIFASVILLFGLMYVLDRDNIPEENLFIALSAQITNKNDIYSPVYTEIR